MPASKRKQKLKNHKFVLISDEKKNTNSNKLATNKATLSSNPFDITRPDTSAAPSNMQPNNSRVSENPSFALHNLSPKKNI